MRVAYSDSPPTLHVVPGRAKPVLHGPNSTEPNLFHHGETTYRVGRLSEYATLMVLRIDLWNKVAVDLESRVASLVRRDKLLDPMLLGAKFSTDTTASLGCNLVISRHCLQDSVLSFSTVRFSFSSQYQNPRRCHEGSVLR